ncbi:hypothetical protein Dip510_001328 [Elusimicrobium posterum]|uniref:hypothetical protein n=1 Tax=Elusimicrobium posterum TaxID=3116653 RepID=UPI003C72C164
MKKLFTAFILLSCTAAVFAQNNSAGRDINEAKNMRGAAILEFLNSFSVNEIENYLTDCATAEQKKMRLEIKNDMFSAPGAWQGQDLIDYDYDKRPQRTDLINILAYDERIVLPKGFTLQEISQDFDYASLVSADTEVVLLGEWVHDKGIEKYIPEVINSLGRDVAGTPFKYYATEFLQSKYQTQLNEAAFTGDWSFLNNIHYAKRQLPLFKAALKNKMRPIALDYMDYTNFSLGYDLPSFQNDKYENFRHADLNLSAAGSTARIPDFLSVAYRNVLWMKQLMPIINKKDGKVLIFAGEGHTHYTTYAREHGSISDRLKAQGVKTLSISFYVNNKNIIPGDKRLLIHVPKDKVALYGADVLIVTGK